MNAEPSVFLDDEEEEDIEAVHLTFRVRGEQYAVGVRHVTEIVRLQEINPVPGMPPAFVGVINLRGHVVPVLDVSVRFGRNALQSSDRTVIIVLEVDGERVGLMVEEVTEVATIPEQDLRPPWTGFSKGENKDSIVKGIARREDELSIVLDVWKLLTDEGGHSGTDSAASPTGAGG